MKKFDNLLGRLKLYWETGKCWLGAGTFIISLMTAIKVYGVPTEYTPFILVLTMLGILFIGLADIHFFRMYQREARATKEINPIFKGLFDNQDRIMSKADEIAVRIDKLEKKVLEK